MRGKTKSRWYSKAPAAANDRGTDNEQIGKIGAVPCERLDAGLGRQPRPRNFFRESLRFKELYGSKR
jgi:hypothetical protein